MLDDEMIGQLADWFDQNEASGVLERLISADHPIKMWLAADMTSTERTRTMVGVLAKGGHIPLLGAAVMLAEPQTRIELCGEVRTVLVNALAGFDFSLFQRQQDLEDTGRDVFISYAHRDAEKVDAIVEVLARLELSCFRDTTSIQPGRSIAVAVRSAIQSARSAAIVVSGHFARSVWAVRETRHILAENRARRKPIFTLVVEDTTLPEELRDIFAFDLRAAGIWSDADLLRQRLQPIKAVLMGTQDVGGRLFQP